MPWRDLSERLGNCNSISKRFCRLKVSGVFERAFNVLSHVFKFEYVFVGSMIVEAHQ